MTLDEAISHLHDKLKDPSSFSCQECRDEHFLLYNWLKELRQRRRLDELHKRKLSAIRKIV